MDQRRLDPASEHPVDHLLLPVNVCLARISKQDHSGSGMQRNRIHGVLHFGGSH
jgi:hypothetical protein